MVGEADKKEEEEDEQQPMEDEQQEEARERLVATAAFVVGSGNACLPRKLFVELLEYMAPHGDPARRGIPLGEELPYEWEIMWDW